ncbi:MAG: BolA/IbaG family iron-sulfur metabolism protein [Gammaproteobacteria bacterium]|nr:BolA/IbaG family iron-sulfur metabolism protein [Rhodocyclaceae bacterium]MBU3908230.1 BolA/IbaG family iron-sulfur metabolism protein [Gammaproteobacteria bacterium]MBU3990789.1 BolA/IbaG family iron-sulfur metabolism protein [Gammaproteobacteria bacterium]MBU4003133.1 BolA/IbaG family iron-sulfur metabolism protein [Gammaproteobacteria bacterium]MBU4019975.1 BolA/IbaG family iron-sulfur metabolism protein [Gammaproteobacteria bacterium]
MLTPKQIEDWIAAGLECSQLAVNGDGRHFEALIVSPLFAGLSRVQRQQRVNAVLKEHFDSEILHALSMQCLTPEEAASRG